MSKRKTVKRQGRLFENGKGLWMDFTIAGKRYRENTGTDDPAKAEENMLKRIAEVRRGVTVNPRGTSFADLEKGLLDDYAARGNRSLTNLPWRLAHLRRAFATVPAMEIGFDKVNAYVKSRLTAPCPDHGRVSGEACEAVRRDGTRCRYRPPRRSTVRYEVALLRRSLVLAHQAGKVPAVPPLPTVAVGDNARKGFASPAQVAEVVSHLPRDLRPLIQVLAWTGWRLNEIATLEWRNVDMAAGTIKLDAAKSKNKRPRTFPFGALPALAEILAEQRERTTAYERASGKVMPAVFWRSGGEPVRAFRKAWRTATKKACLPWLNPHDLRRSAARNLLRSGVSEDVAMKLCGWETRSMLTRYNVTATEDLEQAVGKLARYGIDSRHSETPAGNFQEIQDVEIVAAEGNGNGGAERDRTVDLLTASGINPSPLHPSPTTIPANINARSIKPSRGQGT